MTEDQTKDIEYVRSALIKQIADLVSKADKIKDRLQTEVTIPIVYLKIFSAYLAEQKFNTLEDAWKLMNDIKGIIEKIFYVDHYIFRINESIEQERANKK